MHSVGQQHAVGYGCGVKKLTDTIAIRDADLRAKIEEMVARSGVKLSEIVRAALEVGLPIIERDGIRRTFLPAESAAKQHPKKPTVHDVRRKLKSILDTTRHPPVESGNR